MSSQLCLCTLTRPDDKVIVYEDAGLLHYEAGSAAASSGLRFRLLAGAGKKAGEVVLRALSALSPVVEA